MQSSSPQYQTKSKIKCQPRLIYNKNVPQMTWKFSDK